ncbi:MAG: DUF5685 family protein [Oscillospiraceae bacterium]|nr:DUF5685 family protein [Oscillospiraceae bacterium]
MFGYIKPHFPELLVKQRDLYNAIYCGLCKSLGRETGQISRMGLNYDFVFLALVRSAVTGTPFEVKGCSCLLKCSRSKLMVLPNQHIRYTAAVGSLMAYHKIRDNLQDEGFPKRGAYALAMPAGLYAMRKARAHDLPRQHIADCLQELAQLEQAGEPLVDKPADVFGRLLSGVAAHGISDPAAALVMERIGYHIGRWVYIVDAADDYARDTKSGSYNPFVASGELHSERILSALEMELEQVDKLLEKVGIADSDIAAIIENILVLGMYKAAQKALGNQT